MHAATTPLESAPFAAEARPTADGWSRLEVRGEVDMATAPDLRAALLHELQKHPVRLNLSAVEFIDSSGLAVLIQAVNQAKLEGWKLTVERDLSEPVRRLTELTLVDAVLPFADA